MAQWQCFSEVRIILSDANDNPPHFSQTSYSASVPENSPGARLLLRVHADDPDSGMSVTTLSRKCFGVQKFIEYSLPEILKMRL